MSVKEHFCFDAADECLHQPGPEPTWNESMAFAAVEAHGPALFLRHGRRYNEGHFEVTVAQLNPDGSLDVAFAKRPLSRQDIGDGKRSSGGGLTFTQIEPSKRWAIAYEGKIKTIGHFSAFAENPTAALADARIGEGRLNLEFEDRAPLFGTGPNGSVPGGAKYLSARHYESTGYCKGEMTLNGRTRRVDTYGFRDHSWGMRDMTRAEFTRWFWVQVDATTSCVGWFTRADDVDYSSGIILRNGVGEVATGATLVSTYDTGPDKYIRQCRLVLKSPKGDIAVDLETVAALPLRYTKDGNTTRVVEFASRVKGTNFPAWVEYCDRMVDGLPLGNRRA